jgi:hypothetical protein
MSLRLFNLSIGNPEAAGILPAIRMAGVPPAIRKRDASSPGVQSG